MKNCLSTRRFFLFIFISFPHHLKSECKSTFFHPLKKSELNKVKDKMRRVRNDGRFVFTTATLILQFFFSLLRVVSSFIVSRLSKHDPKYRIHPQGDTSKTSEIEWTRRKMMLHKSGIKKSLHANMTWIHRRFFLRDLKSPRKIHESRTTLSVFLI